MPPREHYRGCGTDGRGIGSSGTGSIGRQPHYTIDVVSH